MKYFKLNTVRVYSAEISLFVGIIIAVFCCFFNIFSESEDISNHILRLHILANSDSEQDQQLKLKVRDAILNEFNFDDAQDNLEEAKRQVESSLPDIKKVAENVVKCEGYDYEIGSELVNMYFDTRKYDDFAMPAGQYDALRITIGEARGHNWWCVLVPSMCVPAADGGTEGICNSLTDEQKNLIEHSDEYELRFVAIEFYEYLKKLVS